jgi:hypothetical protein
MSESRRVFVLALAAASGLIGHARADSILLETSASYSAAGSQVASDDDDATSGAISSGIAVPSSFGQGLPPVFGDGYATASANDQGVSAVTAAAAFYSVDDNLLEAQAVVTRTATNTGTSGQSYSFNFTINGPTLVAHVYDGGLPSDPGAPALTFEVLVRSGANVLWQSTATLLGGFTTNDGLLLELQEGGVDLGGTQFIESSNVGGYRFDSFSGSVDLGEVAAGASVDVETILRVRVAARGTELGGLASIGDPNDLSGNGGFSGGIVASSAVIPEPSTASLMGVGALLVLGVLGGRRRNRPGRGSPRGHARRSRSAPNSVSEATLIRYP